MPLDGNARAQAQFAATPNTDKLNDAEKQTLLTALQTIWGTDTTYLTGNAVVSSGLPAPLGLSYVNPAGTPTNVTGAGTIS